MNVVELFEGFSSPAKWRWVEKKKFEWVAVFIISKVTYTVSLATVSQRYYEDADDEYELSFGAHTATQDFGFGVSDTGNAWKVFGTVIEIARNFITQNEPSVIHIESDTTERSRLAVNRRIASAISLGLPYSVSVEENTIYIIRE